MKYGLALWKWLAQPTLQRRSVAFVLVAFFVVWAVLLGYMYARTQRLNALEPPLRKFGDALSQSLQDIHDPGQAAAALEMTARWINIRRQEIGRLPGQVKFELLDAQGRRVDGHPMLRYVSARIAGEAPAPLELDGQSHLVYQSGGRRWTVRIAEPVRSAESFLAYNSPYLVEYLVLAMPFVLLPVWLSVRNGLRPLKQLADVISRRDPDDLRPLAFAARHSELKPLTGALDGMLERLRQRFDRERLFVQDAAHEIRTPLAVVATQAHVMGHAPSAHERARAYAVLSDAIGRASHLAQQLLMLATLDDAQRPAPRQIDVAQAARELLAQAVPQAMARGIELSLEAPDQLMSLVDEPAFSSIVLNLVDNAIRYGHAGGNVVVTLRGDDERLALQVQDDGPGIAPAEHGLVFERFHRCAGQEVPGSGLGLAIVRQAALRMGGHALVTPGLGHKGVGFLVSIPVPGFRAL